ncbi:MAG: DUF2202 domain-containing protein [Sphaerochaetaceae bacterium]|nr:DUF2202 domain-containing protein [Sphaerochaetaceae bacterium]
MAGVTFIVALSSLFAQGGKEISADNGSEGILLMREEEKLARDVYLTLYDLYSVPVFLNIAQSEQRHTDSVKWLIEQKGLTDPVISDEIGEFSDDELQQLYQILIEQGSQSLSQAFIVGALVEELDIYDIERLLEDEDDIQIIRVYDNLLEGSMNHLRSFYSKIVKSGEDYLPSYITEDRFQQIVQ